jgi:hypothetical protein
MPRTKLYEDEIDAIGKRLVKAEENVRASQSEYERMEWADQVFILRQYVRGMRLGTSISQRMTDGCPQVCSPCSLS